ncbi:MAG: hypothetical protein COY80_00635 [Candidatus Pacebacteria bacterium CG_4_10_14_0_8_um_filter_42_14]|nr:MAG: hypothetical protein COY80_00635 [Candidatus Pacebacteria bacterium CG_4_10_14_0_8_um_filter_42_14]
MQKTVVHLSRLAYPHPGGVERHLDELLPELDRLGFKNTVLTIQDEKNQKLSESRKTYSIIRIRANKRTKLGYKISIWKQIIKYLGLLRTADIIHIHDVFWWPLPILPFISWKKIFITFHGYEKDDGPSFTDIFWHQLAAKVCQANLCIGDFHAKWYKIKPSLVSFGAVKSYKIPKTTKKAGAVFIGQLKEQAGIMQYLEAMSLLRKNKDHLSLDIFGNGPLENIARSYAKKHDLSVRFLGWDENAYKKIGQYKIAFVSRYLSIIESLATGTSVIAVSSNEIKFDYLSMTPYSKDISIAESAEQIMSYAKKPVPVDKKMQSWAREQTWEKLARNYIELWQK